MASLEKSIVLASSPPQVNPILTELDSPFSSLIYDLSQQVQGAMEELLKMINEIDASSAEVTEDMEKCKASALERRKVIEEEKECFQKAAYAVLNVLNIGEIKDDDDDQMFLVNGPEN